MTIYELREKYIERHPRSHYFDADTLKFFGESLSRMRVLKNTEKVTDICGNVHICYAVSSTRHKNWRGTCKPYVHYLFFDVDTLDDVTT